MTSIPDPKLSHKSLTLLGASWLRRQGFSVIETEITAIGSREQPDVIGFRSSSSAIVEVKVSRADFLADRRKPERAEGGAGLGVYRFYLSPVGVVRPEDLPPRWGLLHATGTRGGLIEVRRPTGNIWPKFGSAEWGDWAEFQHEACPVKERAMLFSIARRLSKAQGLPRGDLAPK